MQETKKKDGGVLSARGRGLYRKVRHERLGSARVGRVRVGLGISAATRATLVDFYDERSFRIWCIIALDSST